MIGDNEFQLDASPLDGDRNVKAPLVITQYLGSVAPG